MLLVPQNIPALSEEPPVALIKARRHSSIVKILKWMIPGVCALSILTISLISWLDPLRALASMPINIDSLSMSGTKLTMEGPQLAGFTSNSEAYKIHAKTAAQDITNPSIVELKGISAQIETQDKNRFDLKATNGMLDTKSEGLELSEGIIITSTNGYEGKLQDAIVNLRKGTIVTDHPVMLKMMNGSLRADRMQIGDRGNYILFNGKVSMFLMLPNADQEAVTGTTVKKAIP